MNTGRDKEIIGRPSQDFDYQVIAGVHHTCNSKHGSMDKILFGISWV